jgi:protein-tyrosine phosphatase
MPVEMNPDVESASLSFWEPEKKEEVKDLGSPEVPLEQAKAALEKKAAETKLQPNIRSLYKTVAYETSLAYTQLGQGNWWTKIDPFNIYLGGIPLKNKGHLEQIAALGVTKVLGVLEDFELEDGYVNSPAKVADWDTKGISFEQVKAADFLPLTEQEFDDGIEKLDKAFKAGRTIYLHCKAGKGRSVAVLIAYFMKHHKMTFDEAFTLVKNLRPQINLNPAQRKAIFNYFKIPETPEAPATSWILMTEENLTQVLESMLDYVIDGSSYELGQQVPAMLASWTPSTKIESTISRRNRYLREYQGDQKAATEAAIARNHSYIRKAQVFAADAVPIIGAPTSYSISLWYQLREIALIVAIHGHDVHDPKVKMKILSALIGGDFLKIPAATVDFIARKIMKQVLIETGIRGIAPGIPAHLIFNFFSDNAAKVSTHAKALFAEGNSIPVPATEYQSAHA